MDHWTFHHGKYLQRQRRHGNAQLISPTHCLRHLIGRPHRGRTHHRIQIFPLSGVFRDSVFRRNVFQWVPTNTWPNWKYTTVKSTSSNWIQHPSFAYFEIWNLKFNGTIRKNNTPTVLWTMLVAWQRQCQPCWARRGMRAQLRLYRGLILNQKDSISG